MRIFVQDPSESDLALVRDIACCDGVVLSNSPRPAQADRIVELAKIQCGPLLIQVPAAPLQEQIHQVMSLIQYSPEVVPCLEYSRDTLQALSALNERDIAVAVCNLTHTMQALLSVKAGAAFLILDLPDTDDPLEFPTRVVSLLDNYAFDVDLFVHAVGRGAEVVEECGLLGVDGVVLATAQIEKQW